MNKTILILATAIIALAATSCKHTETTYYPDGRTESVIQYKGKKEHGKTIYYYQNPNTVEMEVEMRNGKRNGEFRRLSTDCSTPTVFMRMIPSKGWR